MRKQRPKIDTNFKTSGLIERRFVELMEQCWQHDPNERPSIFDVLKSLRELERHVKGQSSNVSLMAAKQNSMKDGGVKRGLRKSISK
jgi:hypothetical protein